MAVGTFSRNQSPCGGICGAPIELANGVHETQSLNTAKKPESPAGVLRSSRHLLMMLEAILTVEVLD
jgi:hypothetical protein